MFWIKIKVDGMFWKSAFLICVLHWRSTQESHIADRGAPRLTVCCCCWWWWRLWWWWWCWRRLWWWLWRWLLFFLFYLLSDGIRKTPWSTLSHNVSHSRTHESNCCVFFSNKTQHLLALGLSLTRKSCFLPQGSDWLANFRHHLRESNNTLEMLSYRHRSVLVTHNIRCWGWL